MVLKYQDPENTNENFAKIALAKFFDYATRHQQYTRGGQTYITRVGAMTVGFFCCTMNYSFEENANILFQIV